MSTALSVRQKHRANQLWVRNGQRRCVRCKAPVLAILTSGGRALVLDAVPSRVNGHIFVRGEQSYTPRADVWEKEDAQASRAAGVPFYAEHRETCRFRDEPEPENE